MSHQLHFVEGLKKQHVIKGQDEGKMIQSGTVNFGMTTNAAAYSGTVNCPNKNVSLGGTILDSLTSHCLPWMMALLKGRFSHTAIQNMHQSYKDHCKQYPAMTCDGKATFWNGLQLNVNFSSAHHTDNSDIPGLPCVVMGLVVVGGCLRIYPQRKTNPDLCFNVNLQPGDVLFFDSRCYHEVISNQVSTFRDTNGHYMKGRTSLVFMANIQRHVYMTHENLKKDIMKRRLEKVGVLQTTKRHPWDTNSFWQWSCEMN